jgi:beta-glucosidase
MSDQPDPVEALAERLTLPEKVDLLAGAGMWWTTPVERLGIGRLKMTDGPTGARGDGTSHTTSTCFPVGVCLGATFDTDLLERIGRALSAEAQAKGAQLLLGPTVNLQRHPIGGRVFECYSEDPVVSARLGAAWVNGVQAEGRVGACVKHFVCNDQEFERHTIDVVVSERALRELYLRPFEEIVATAAPWSVMSAYNRVNGVYASSHTELLEGVLGGEWGWDGAVVSDWGAALQTVANALGGLDIEMPGPPRTRGAALLEAVAAGDVPEEVIERRARSVLRLLGRAGRLGDTGEPAEESLDRPEHRELAFEAAVTGIVMLHDRGGVLPLGRPTSLALIGPNAEPGRIQGGGSSIVFPHHQVPLPTALAEALPGVVLTQVLGAVNDRYVALPDRSWFHQPGGSPGLRCEYVNGGDPAGPVVASRAAGRPLLAFVASVPDGVDRFDHCCVFRGTLTLPAGTLPIGALSTGALRRGGALSAGGDVPEGGDVDFGLTAAGPARILLDGELVVDNWTAPERGDTFFSHGSRERTARVALQEGRPYQLMVEYRRPPEVPIPGLRVGIAPVVDLDALLEEAIAAASAAEVAVVVVGLTDDWESEGFDRPMFAMPGRQEELVRRVAAANPRTVVVLNAGSPVALDWADEVGALLQCWYAGQEHGPALAAVLSGAAEPGGRLPLTVPRRLEDTPAFAHYPGRGGRAVYGEDLLVGYRWYQRQGIEPRYPFGHGRGYTTWAWGQPSVEGQGTELTVEVELTNTGARQGTEVVQVYRRWLDEEDAGRPVRELVGFARVRAHPAETVAAQVRVDGHAFRRWQDGGWIVPSGRFALEVGASVDDIHGEVLGDLP